MPIDPERIETTPAKVTFSGEGLQRMSITEFRAIAVRLGRIGLEIESVEYPWGHMDDSDSLADPQIEISKSHFIKTADRHDLLQSTASKTWQSIWRRKELHDRAVEKQQSGKRLLWSEEVVLRQFPAWRLELYTADDTLHFGKLRRAYHAGLLDELLYMGPKLLNVVALVLDDIETDELEKPSPEKS